MKPIAFIDSGLGGLPYLDYTRGLIPHACYVYGADNLGFPYGTKSEQEIIDTFSAMVERMIRQHDPELFVVACNTASVVALSWLREHYDHDFVGVVPAVKPAAETSRKRAIGVLATERTIRGAYLQDLVDRFAPDCSIHRKAATELIAAIEDDPFALDRDKYRTLLGAIRDEYLDNGVDTIVLGCTHFLLLKDLFFETMGSRLSILDSRDGVARQVVRIIERHGGYDPCKTGASSFWLTGPSMKEDKYRRIAEVYGMSYGGVLGG